MLQGQDWTPVVIKKTTKQILKGDVKTNQQIIKETRTKADSTQQQYASRVRNLESDLDKNIDEVPVVHQNILDTKQRNMLTVSRTQKNLTRIQLGKLINEQSSVIDNLETGKIVNNINVLQKINKILGTTLKFNK